MSFPLIKIAETLHCKNCGVSVAPTAAQKWKLKNKLIDGIYCSRSCKAAGSRRRQTATCAVCGKTITRLLSQVKKSKSGKIFCSPKCGTIWSNWTGPKFKDRSILEKSIEEGLRKLFPETKIHFGDKSPIDGSVDIWIPDLNLAIEINGPHHYEPIRGNISAYLSTVKNDLRKIRLSQAAGIKLYVLNARKLKGKKAFRLYFPQIAKLIAGFLDAKESK
jgi:hypothetical protein